jgi:hypothetical protein
MIELVEAPLERNQLFVASGQLGLEPGFGRRRLRVQPALNQAVEVVLAKKLTKRVFVA